MEIHIVANAALGSSLSGGDRIFIECARRWAARGHRVFVYVWEEGREMCRRNRLEGVELVLWSAAKYKKYGFAVNYIMRTLIGLFAALKRKPCKGPAVVYSASDFWPDSIPAFVMSLKLRALWTAGFYLFAPGPFKGFNGTPRLRDLLYYIHQRPMYRLIKAKADAVFVTCEDDREAFINAGREPEEVYTVRGGVDAKTPCRFKDESQKDFDACFVGRFHPQKGILELISIWEGVVKSRPNARLAIIGSDSVEYRRQVEKAIASKGLKMNIDLMGFMDGEEKYNVFRRSRVIVHPAIYDSGGMAACEGMAWGLPAVGFDLPALRRYYPKGMLKAPSGRLDIFAELLLKLLEDEGLYERTKADALSLAREWDWDSRADDMLRFLENRLAKARAGKGLAWARS